jgi:hypothetical protein
MVQPAPIDQVLKWGKGNDIWAFAVVEQLAEPSQDPIDTPLESILEQFKDVFEEPQSLPPHRSYDHHIPLIPDAVPVNARPYKYSPQHKDEIEKQVKELLAKGLITTSTSPFASLVLLILKKDGSLKGSMQYGLEGGGVNRPAHKFKLFLQKDCQTPEPPRLFSEPPNEAASENKLRTSENC